MTKIKDRAQARKFFEDGGAVVRIRCFKTEAWIWVISDTDTQLKDHLFNHCLENEVIKVGSLDIDNVPKSYVLNHLWQVGAKPRPKPVDVVSG